MKLISKTFLAAVCVLLSTHANSQQINTCFPDRMEPTSDEIYNNFKSRTFIIFRKESSRVIVNAFYFSPEGDLYSKAGKNARGKWKSHECSDEKNCRPHLEYELEICKDCGYYESLGFTLDSFKEYSNSKVECYSGDILGLSTSDIYLKLGKDQVTEVRRLIKDRMGN